MANEVLLCCQHSQSILTITHKSGCFVLLVNSLKDSFILNREIPWSVKKQLNRIYVSQERTLVTSNVIAEIIFIILMSHSQISRKSIFAVEDSEVLFFKDVLGSNPQSNSLYKMI